MVMNAPSKENRVVVETSQKPLDADVDFSRGFTKNDPSSTQGNDEALSYGAMDLPKIVTFITRECTTPYKKTQT